MSRNIRLINVNGIKIGNTLITPEILDSDAQQWDGYRLNPGIGKEKLKINDDILLRQICYELMPFVIVADKVKPITLHAELKRFPYTIDGKLAFQEFAVRLIPESDRIAHFIMIGSSGLAVNQQSISAELIAMELGNGSLYLEVYMNPVDASMLQPLRPCTGFQLDYISPTWK